MNASGTRRPGASRWTHVHKPEGVIFVSCTLTTGGVVLVSSTRLLYLWQGDATRLIPLDIEVQQAVTCSRVTYLRSSTDTLHTLLVPRAEEMGHKLGCVPTGLAAQHVLRAGHMLLLA